MGELDVRAVAPLEEATDTNPFALQRLEVLGPIGRAAFVDAGGEIGAPVVADVSSG